MMNYFLPLLGIVVLCVFWGLFQQWLLQTDPDVKKQSLKCGGCGRGGECDIEEHER
jgi:hypothetical protein